METVLNLLLIRFALIVAALVVVALIAFAAAVILKRRGKLHQARQHVASAATATLRYLDDRNNQQDRLSRPRGRGTLARTMIGVAARYVDQTRDPRRPEDRR
ncbi:MAG TPA: hypothetical protein VHU91_10505 [Mycobacteriales bacterium]|jgi:hypothetical protein|nr:hypothetical protein [Mycobacteriales bacterium]